MDKGKYDKKTIFLFITGFIALPLIIIFAFVSILNLAFSKGTPVTPEPDRPVCYPGQVSDQAAFDQRGVDIPNKPPAQNAQTSSINFVKTGHTLQGYIKSQKNQEEIVAFGIWKPTVYDAGDIINKTYTVQYGDTLWWIANAYYGNPYDYGKIIAANFYQIGFLPDGEHALIYPGQVLNLP